MTSDDRITKKLLESSGLAKCVGCGKAVPGLMDGDEALCGACSYPDDGPACMRCGEPTLGQSHGENAGKCPLCPDDGQPHDHLAKWHAFGPKVTRH